MSTVKIYTACKFEYFFDFRPLHFGGKCGKIFVKERSAVICRKAQLHGDRTEICMKFLFGTKLRFFWVVIPMAALLAVAIVYNGKAEGLLKFYPLIIFLAGAIIFSLIYFFRLVGLGFDEVRTAGLFSSRERVMINEGKELIVTLLPKRKLQFEIFGNDGVLAELDWLSLDEDGKIPDINLFRAKSIGGKRAVRSILKFYGVPSKDDAAAIIKGDASYEDELVRISSKESEIKLREIHIYFKKTV